MGNGIVTRVDGGERVPVGDPEQIQDRQLMRSIKQNTGGQPVDPNALMAIRNAALAGGGQATVSQGVITDSAPAVTAADTRPIPAATTPPDPSAPAPALEAPPVAPPPALPHRQKPVVEPAPTAPAPEQALASAPVSKTAADQERIANIMARAKQRLAEFGASTAQTVTAKADEGKASRYSPDPDTGRKFDEGPATKDKYYPDYAKGRDYLKKLKANFSLKMTRVSRLLRKSIGTRYAVKLKALRTAIRAELGKVADVAEQLRAKPVSYKPEPDTARKDEEGARSKDKRMGPDTNPTNNDLSKMWSSNKHMPRVAEGIYDPEGDEGKNPKDKNKDMGGNSMEALPKDKDAGETKDAPKGKEKGKGSAEQIKNLQIAVKELEKKDADFQKEIDVLTEAVEGLGGKPKAKDKGKDKAKGPEGPRAGGPPSEKPPMAEPMLDVAPSLGAPKARSLRGRTRLARTALRKRGTAGPGRGGNPRTDDERLERHKQVHPDDGAKSTKDLPPRGTGRGPGKGTGRGPGAGGGRKGNPRTDDERLKNHQKTYPKDKAKSTKDLPPRGTGLGKGRAQGKQKPGADDARGIQAEFVRGPSKLYSYWSVTDADKKVILKAKAKEAFGKEAFKQWPWFHSKEYGAFLIASIRSRGIKAVAAEMHVRPTMTKEAMRIEIRAAKGGSALTKKITNEKAYYSEAYGDPGYASKLVQKYKGKKPSGQAIGKGGKAKASVRGDNIVTALNLELESENARLRERLATQANQTDKIAAEKKVEAAKNAQHELDTALRVRAERAIALTERLAAKNLIDNTDANKKATIDNMMDMDDLGFQAVERMAERQVISRIEETEKRLAPKATIVRTGGLTAAPVTPVKSSTFQEELEGIWSKKQGSTKTR